LKVSGKRTPTWLSLPRWQPGAGSRWSRFTEWWKAAIVGNDRMVDTRGDGPGEHGTVVLILSRQHAEVLANWLTRSEGHDPCLDSLLSQLPRSIADVSDQPPPDFSVFAAAQEVVENAQIDIVAEWEAEDVALAAAGTERSVLEAALTTAKAAASERIRKVDAADTAARELAQTAALTATVVEKRADAKAERVASAAAQAAEVVAASFTSGGDAKTALAALRLAATVDAAAIATAEETALAAAAVATAVATAAAQAALAAATAAAAFEQEVANAAAAIRLIATTAARDLAVEADARAVEVALDARQSRRS
jgi:hypothetical protein